MSCDSGCSQAPIIINTGGGSESPGGGLVDSVSGEGVIDVTPITGDPVVSVSPGADGQVLTTNGTDVEWGNTPNIYSFVAPDSHSSDPGNVNDRTILIPPGIFTNPPVVLAISGNENRAVDSVVTISSTQFTAKVRDVRTAGGNFFGATNIQVIAIEQ